MGLVLQEGVGRRRMMLSMDPYTPGDPIFNWRGRYWRESRSGVVPRYGIRHELLRK